MNVLFIGSAEDRLSEFYMNLFEPLQTRVSVTSRSLEIVGTRESHFYLHHFHKNGQEYPIYVLEFINENNTLVKDLVEKELDKYKLAI